MRIDLYASRPHYASHLLPVWQALPKHLRGRVYGPDPTQWWVRDAPPSTPDPTTTTMIAGFADLQALRGQGPYIYVEHGAGQHYPGDPLAVNDPSYSGGAGHEDVDLYICPSETVARRWEARYPGVDAVAVGCPVLDAWHSGDRPFMPEPKPTIAITFHWDCWLVPETRSAFRHYEAGIGPCVAAWRAEGFAVVGHGHPRVSDALGPVWAEHGVPVVNLGWVYDHADILVADNTSVMYEFASLGRDVVALNAPWYRRTVNHGLRFWSHVPGYQADDVDQLHDLVSAIAGGDSGARAGSALMRAGAVAETYHRVDGYACRRAAMAIAKLEDRTYERSG